MIGTTLDKYEVLQKIGEGGMATVYRGRHSTLDRDVAIKVLHPHLSSSSRNRMRFAREAKAVERLRHDNILEIFDYSGSDADDCYIVTEFVDGETLTHLLHRSGRMPSEIVTLIGIEVARALGYAHREGILHRDLKTDNVMVRVDGAVKLMDFGIARFLDESQVTMTGALVGSPAFMSPEQAQELPLDARSDLFSLGTVLFYLVTGHLPFSGSNPSLILKNVIEGNRPHVTELAPTMSASLADVVEQLLSPSADDRFVTAFDVERALLACLVETQIDRRADEWSVAAFIIDPDAWGQRLDLHLTRVLADEGRKRLAEGDHLAALRLFNRLLSMDEDNAEVLALVQNLHGDPTATSSNSWRWASVFVLALVAIIGAWRWWVVTPEELPPARSPVAETTAREPGVPAAVFVGEPQRPEVVDVPATRSTDGEEPVTRGTAAASVHGESPPSVVVDPPSAAVEDTPPRDAPPKRVQPPASGAAVAHEPPQIEPAPFGKLLVVVSRGYMAEVLLDGQPVGQVRQEIPVPPGTYDLTVRAEFAKPYLQRDVSIGSDERRVVNVTLELLGREVRFVGWSDDCRLRADGVESNTLGELEHYWWVQRPDKELSLEVTCPDGRHATQRWPHLLENQVFEAPSTNGDPPDDR